MNVIRIFEAQMKREKPLYYLTLKVAVSAFFVGIFSFLLTWFGVWLDSDNIRIAGIIIGAGAILIGLISFAVLLALLIYYLFKSGVKKHRENL